MARQLIARIRDSPRVPWHTGPAIVGDMRERGQGSVEWIALLAVVLGALAAIGSVAAHVLLARAAPPPDPLEAAYGRDTAALVRHVAPGLIYERGMRDHPVDPSTCRARACAENGEPPVVFTHVVRRGATVYVQFWLYFPDSSWNGIAGRHRDDWESFQVRVGPDGRVEARASAHHGYTGRRIGPDLNVNQVEPNWVPRRWRAGWTDSTGWLRVARDSHAGYVARGPWGRRFTPATDVRLIPLESAHLPEGYAIVPPWRKRVYADPESVRT
jgi:hypothetical protein